MGNLIDANALYQRLKDPNLVIVDVRFDLKSPEKGRRDYQAGHLPGAFYLSLEAELSAPVGEHGGRHPLPDLDVLVKTLEAIGIGSRSHVVAYDDSGGMVASRLWWMLKYLGHDGVQVLDGGYQAWLEAGYPITTEIPVSRPATFTPRRRPHLIAGIDNVRAALQNPHVVLVDARAADRYRGENETLDRKAGHIPSALNFPYPENLEGGKFKDVAALKEQFREIEKADEIIVYCGSGVSAAHDLIALEEAGIRGAKLYVGSWSDWISYDENPVASGAEP